MKVVINSCFGGFGLSRLALEELSKLGVDTYKSWEDLKNKNDDEIWILLNDEDSASNYRDFRTDENLISVVEKLVEKSYGMCGKLSIIDIPDGVEYEIDEYDGLESIHEVHRSWE